jgi:hypothetical protein
LSYAVAAYARLEEIPLLAVRGVALLRPRAARGCGGRVLRRGASDEPERAVGLCAVVEAGRWASQNTVLGWVAADIGEDARGGRRLRHADVLVRAGTDLAGREVRRRCDGPNRRRELLTDGMAPG